MANITTTDRTTELLAPQMDFILIDRSGSMADKWYALLGALDGFVDVLKANNVASHTIVSLFDSRETVGTVVFDGPLAQLPRIGQIAGTTRGMTALYDAIMFMGQEMASYAPERASIVIVTDGDDSRGFSGSQTDHTQAKAVLDWCRAQGWQVTFFGCDFDNSSQAKLLGMDEKNAVGVRKQKLLEAAKALGEKRARHARGADDIEFSDDERQKFGGLLGYSGNK